MRGPALALAVLPLLAPPALPQEPGGGDLVVLTKEAEPFVVRGPDGQWSGIAVQLWQRVAEDLDRGWSFREATLAEMIDGVAEGRADVAVGALTLTAERETRLDFCYPFHSSGLGLAVRSHGSRWAVLVRAVLSPAFLQAVLALTVLMLGVGSLMWLFERRRNQGEFGGSPLRGLGAGFWWSAVTMTTVGYGDKTPRTLPGRLVGLVWMFASIVLISGFTAAIASSLTVAHLGSTIQGPEDLSGARVGSVPGSTSAEWLERRDQRFEAFDTARAAVAALAADELDAVVYDAPLLQWLAVTDFPEVLVLPRTLERQDYAFAVPTGSPLREDLNRALLAQMTSDEWRHTLARHLGE